MLAVIAWMAVIFALSSIPSEVPSPGTRFLPPDKIAHFVEYAVLGFLLYAAGRPYVVRTRGAWVLVGVSVGIAVLYGISDEFHQSFVSGRDADVGDLVADALGAVAGALAGLVLVRRSTNQQPRT